MKVNFKTIAQAETKDFGKFELFPLEKGFGLTVGNALRRVLLTNLPGAAITAVTIDGITHQFTTLSGMKEDVVELLLNLKQVRFEFSGDKPVEAHLTVSGPTKVKAGDIVVPAGVKVINKDLVLATLADKKTKLSVVLEVSPGYGYLPAKDRAPKKLSEIILDASFSPVVRVNYNIETARVGRRTDLDKLVMEIFTDATIKPSKALEAAAKILISHFNQIIKPVFEAEEPVATVVSSDDEVLKLSVEELDLPTRIANALKKGGFVTVKDLASTTKEAIAKVKNLGGKSVDIVLKKLKTKGVEVK
ncbi:MAG: DNA-directed RNA polymerase subunit alpha [Candidatus Beckwithbacteria bacterium]|nr:DNA-directed RNA polymerase subunit alpha [Candidatus Beckwithbacteria bacterium]